MLIVLIFQVFTCYLRNSSSAISNDVCNLSLLLPIHVQQFKNLLNLHILYPVKKLFHLLNLCYYLQAFRFFFPDLLVYSLLLIRIRYHHRCPNFRIGKIFT